MELMRKQVKLKHMKFSNGIPKTDTHDYMGDSVVLKKLQKEMEIQKRKSIMN